MKFCADLHCHTVSSGHSYSSLAELAKEAAKKKLQIIAITDHGPSMPGGPHVFQIMNQKVVPNYIDGVRILKGVEANIIDLNGKLDIPNNLLDKLDLVIASFHDVCLAPGSVLQNTNSIIQAMNNPYVDIIGHIGNPYFPVDAEKVVDSALRTGKLIEINNSSFLSSRIGSEKNCKNIAQLAKLNGAKLVVTSDAHAAYGIGTFEEAEKLLTGLSIPESQ